MLQAPALKRQQRQAALCQLNSIRCPIPVWPTKMWGLCARQWRVSSQKQRHSMALLASLHRQARMQMLGQPLIKKMRQQWHWTTARTVGLSRRTEMPARRQRTR